jgi:hypothetical protein
MKAYLGDGVYADATPYGIVLTTENGLETTNTIQMEPEVIRLLIKYLIKVIGEEAFTKMVPSRVLAVWQNSNTQRSKS